MERWWEIARHRVAIGGRVVDEKTKRPVAGAVVDLTAVPDEFKVRCTASVDAASQSGSHRVTCLDQTRTSDAGYYYFLDLPEGAYELRATGLRRNPPIATGRAKVSVDQSGNVVRAAVDLILKYLRDEPKRS